MRVIHCYHSNKNMTVLEALLVTSQRSGITLDFGEYYKQFSEISFLHIVREWKPKYSCVPSLNWTIGLLNLKVQLLVSRLSTVYLYMRYVRSISDAINDYLVICAKPIAHIFFLCCVYILSVWAMLQFIINNIIIVSVVVWSCAQAKHAVCIYHTAYTTVLMSYWFVLLHRSI